MASEKTASVKLTLNGSSYIVAIKEAAKENERAAQKSGNAWKTAGVNGLKAFGKELGGIATSAKNTIRTIGGLGGAVSLTAGIKTAIDLRGEFKKLAFQVQAGSGQMVDWRGLMEGAQQEAIKWGLATEELGQGLGTMRSITGELDFAKESLGAVAMAARATGEPIAALAEVAGKMHQKFGVGANQMAEGLAVAYSLANQGEIEFGDMATIIDRAGSSAKFLGVSGVEGLSRVVGMARLAAGDAKGLRAALSGTMSLMEQLGSSEGTKKLGQDFGLVMKKGEGFESMMGRVLKRTGGKESVLVKGFQGEQLKVVSELAKVYRAAFEGTSGTVEQKTKAALDAYQKHMEEAAKSNLDAAALRKKAEQAALGPAAQLESALQRLKAAFTTPAFIGSLDKITAQLPMLSQKLGDFIGLVLENPKTSLAVAAGVKLGAAVIPSMMQVGAQAFGKAALNAVATGGGGAVPVGGVAGRVGAVAAAGAAGYALGSLFTDYAVDPAQRESAAKSRTLSEAVMAADVNLTGTTSKGALESSLSEIRARREAAEKDKGFQASDVYTLGLRRVYGTSSDEEIQKAKDAESKIVAALSKLADAVTDKAGDIKNVKIDAPGGGGGGGGGGAYRGPPRPAPPGPGYSR